MSRSNYCSVDGCDGFTGVPGTARGLCGAHYNRLRKHGDVLADVPLKGRSHDGRCRICRRELPLDSFEIRKDSGRHRWECKECRVRISAEWAKGNVAKRREIQRRYEVKPESRVKSRVAYLMRTYGLSREDAEAIRRDGLCAICGTDGPLHVDHCHESGLIRGMLCGLCNRGIGTFKDDPNLMRAAARYVEETSEKQVTGQA